MGVVAGAVIGAWIGMGIPENAAKRHDAKTDSGNILISVQVDEMRQAKLAKSIFIEAGAEDIAMTGEAETPARQISAKQVEVHAVA
jgi:outer membrane lipoprotein SlyB